MYLCMHTCVNTRVAHVDAVEARNETAARQSVRLEGDSDRTGLIDGRPAPADICFICVRWRPWLWSAHMACTSLQLPATMTAKGGREWTACAKEEEGVALMWGDLKTRCVLVLKSWLSVIDAKRADPHPAVIIQCRGFKPVQPNSSALDLNIFSKANISCFTASFPTGVYSGGGFISTELMS